MGKTPQQVAKEQRNEEISKELGIVDDSIPQNPSDLPTPLPISQSPSNNLFQWIPSDTSNQDTDSFG